MHLSTYKFAIYFLFDCFYCIYRLFWSLCNSYFQLKISILQILQHWQRMLNYLISGYDAFIDHSQVEKRGSWKQKYLSPPPPPQASRCTSWWCQPVLAGNKCGGQLCIHGAGLQPGAWVMPTGRRKDAGAASLGGCNRRETSGGFFMQTTWC